MSKSAAQNENPDRFSCADTQWFHNVCTGPYFYSNLLFSELKTTVLQNYDLGQWKVTCNSLTKVNLKKKAVVRKRKNNDSPNIKQLRHQSATILLTNNLLMRQSELIYIYYVLYGTE